MWLSHGAVPRDDPFSVSGDLHGLMGGAPPEIRPTGDIAAWYQKLCTSSSGVLYEDTHLQVCTCLSLPSHPTLHRQITDAASSQSGIRHARLESMHPACLSCLTQASWAGDHTLYNPTVACEMLQGIL